MKIGSEVQLDFCDVCIKPRRSTIRSRSEPDLTRTFTFKHSPQVLTAIPVVAANMYTVGTPAMAETLAGLNMMTAISKFADRSEMKSLFTHYPTATRSIYSVGMSKTDLDDLKAFRARVHDYGGDVTMVCIDVANGYMADLATFVSDTRAMFPDMTIIAGNVVDELGTEELLASGADIVKVGIGSGAVCTTRNIAGVGRPQLSAIVDCAAVADDMGGHIMSDGGCVVPGDVAKAFAAGADFVMIGSMLAGHVEGPAPDPETGKIIHYGMSSKLAQEKHYGEVAEYRASEGRIVGISPRGSARDTAGEILGGVRSACAYTGARTIEQLPSLASFYRVNRQLNTSYTHMEIR